MNSNNNYSDILRLRSQEFYSNVLNTDLRQLSAQTTPQTTQQTTTDRLVVRQNQNWLQMNPILRSNSSLSLDQKRSQNKSNNQNNNQFLTSNSIDFKDFQELRECRFGSDRTTPSTTSTSVSSVVKTSSKTVMAKKSRTIHSIQSLSISNENLSKIQTKSREKASKTKSLFFKTKPNDGIESSKADLISEETERRRRLRQLFIHYDIQSALSLDELFVDDNTNDNKPTTPTTTTTPDTTTTTTTDHLKNDDDFENEFNSNSLLGFSQNYRNE